MSVNHMDVWNFVGFIYYSSCPGANGIIEVRGLGVEKNQMSHNNKLNKSFHNYCV